jgi:hypothetical protein
LLLQRTSDTTLWLYLNVLEILEEEAMETDEDEIIHQNSPGRIADSYYLGIVGTGETRQTERGFVSGLLLVFYQENRVTPQMLALRNVFHVSIQSPGSTPSRQQVHAAPSQRAKIHVSFAEN